MVEQMLIGVRRDGRPQGRGGTGATEDPPTDCAVGLLASGPDGTEHRVPGVRVGIGRHIRDLAFPVGEGSVRPRAVLIPGLREHCAEATATTIAERVYRVARGRRA